MNLRVLGLLIPLVLLSSCSNSTTSNQGMRGGHKMDVIRIKSQAFEEGGKIPKQYTCDGGDVSPQLSWTGIPKNARTIALICEDPDAPSGNWVHWVLYGLPASMKEVPQHIPPQKALASGAKQGMNDFKKIGYNGPCPPSGTHRYYFRVYALDIAPNLDPGATKAQLMDAVEDHILAQGELMGKYSRQ